MSWISFIVLSSLLCDTHLEKVPFSHTKRKTTRKMYLQWIKKSMKTKLYLVAINSPKVLQMAGKPWSIKDIKVAGHILPFPPHVDARSTSLAEFKLPLAWRFASVFLGRESWPRYHRARNIWTIFCYKLGTKRNLRKCCCRKAAQYS